MSPLGWIRSVIRTRQVLVVAPAALLVAGLIGTLVVSSGSGGSHKTKVDSSVAPGAALQPTVSNVRSNAASNARVGGNRAGSKPVTVRSAATTTSSTVAGYTPSAPPKVDAPTSTTPTSVAPATTTTVPIKPTSPWHAQTLPAGTEELLAMSCPGREECMAVGTSIVTTTDGGASWQVDDVPVSRAGGSDIFNGVWCVSPSTCWIVGQDGAVYHTDTFGRSWADVSPSAEFNVESLGAISCTSSRYCIAVGTEAESVGIVIYTTDGGADWNEVATGADFNSISCPSATDCWIAGAESGGNDNNSGHPQIEFSGDGGHTWASQDDFTSLPSGGGFSSISCPDVENCVAIGDYPLSPGQPPTEAVVASTSDGGQTWATETPPPNVASLRGVTCLSSQECIAVAGRSNGGSSVIQSLNGGTTWTADYVSTSSFMTTSCVASGSCWASGFIYQPGGSAPYPASVASSIT